MKQLDENQRKIYIRYLENHVSPKRAQHCLGVAQTAVRLAHQYGADTQKAEIAGLLHDCAKGLSYPQLVAAAIGFGMEPDVWQLAVPEVLHPYVGAEMVKRDLGIEDVEVLQAIRRHMCGAADMTTLDAVVNLADYIEPTRSYPDVNEMRQMAEGSLFDTLCECLGRTLILNIKAGKIQHPDTLVTWNALKMRVAAKEGEAK